MQVKSFVLCNIISDGLSTLQPATYGYGDCIKRLSIILPVAERLIKISLPDVMV